jgi:hypothetical protein
MSTIKSSTEHLTLNADGAGKEIKFQANGVEKASINSTGVMTATSYAGDGSALTGVGPAKASSNPLITTNGTLGDQWVNTTTGEMFILADATTDANVWKGQNGSSVTPIVDIDFDILLYTGTGSNPRGITGLGFQPDFVWIKCRSQAQHHALFDTVRGFGLSKGLDTCHNSAEGAESTNYGHLVSADSDGFTVGHSSAGGSNGDAHTNRVSQTYVAWCWELPSDNAGNTTGGNGASKTYTNKSNGWMSVTTFVGNSATQHGIPHHLDAAPEFLWVKHRTTTGNHQAYSKDVGNNKVFNVNAPTAPWVSSTRWDNTTPTATEVKLGTDWEVNNNNDNYVMYAFTSVAGKCKVGSYTGGSGNITISGVGFEPAFVMVKSTSNATDWMIHDNMRTPSSGTYLKPNLSDAEITDGGYAMTMNSDGFTWSGGANSRGNVSGASYIYLAIAKQL